MKAGDSRDDEAGAASTMLSTLQAEFGNSEFTAKDIIAILDAGDPPRSACPPTRQRGKAQTACSTRSVSCSGGGSIGPLPGQSAKSSTTASSIGRPSSTTSDVAVVLKASWEKHTSRYRVQALPRDSLDHATAGPSTTETMSPISPISLPAAHSQARGEMGDMGEIISASRRPWNA